MSTELVDRRILTALRLRDATTGVAVADRLTVTADGVVWIRNRRGYYVASVVEGLETHVNAFESPPPTPAVGSVETEVTVTDPRGRFLSRRRTIALPRDPNPAAADSLFDVIDIDLFPSPIAPVAHGWAVVRATVLGSDPAERIPGALLRVIRTSSSEHLASGVSDARGEALVAVPGIPVTTFDEDNVDPENPGPVVTTEIEATIQVIVDSAGPSIPDPDDLEARSTVLLLREQNVFLASGREMTIEL